MTGKSISGIAKGLCPAFLKAPLARFYIAIKYIRRTDVKIGRGTLLGLNSRLEGHIKIGSNSNLSGSSIGTGSYFAGNCSMPATRVGRFCSIGPNVRTCLGAHPTRTFVSTHPAFFSTMGQAGFTFVNENGFTEIRRVQGSDYVVEIGNDVWIGANVTILDGITIGDGAIVGTGSVVTRDIPPYSINVGVPARRIGMRFDDETVGYLVALKWWNRDMEWIRRYAPYFRDVVRLKEALRAETVQRPDSLG